MESREFEWTPAQPGRYLIGVRAVDTQGNKGSLTTSRVNISEDISIVVTEDETATLTATSTEPVTTETPIITAVQTETPGTDVAPLAPSVVAKTNANCREGPGTMPEILGIEAESDEDPIINAERARRPEISWRWDGDAASINGFVFYVDGKMAHWVPGGEMRNSSVIFPSACGGKYEVQIAAQSLNARSPLSQSVTYQQPACPLLVEVRFESVMSTETDDTSCAFPDISSCFPYKLCDEIGVYYMLWASGSVTEQIRVGSSQMPYTYKCDTLYDFVKHLGAPTNTIIVPIDPLSPEVRFGTRFWESDLHEDNRFGIAFKILPYSYDQWSMVDEEHILTAPKMDGTADLIVKVHVQGYYYQAP